MKLRFVMPKGRMKWKLRRDWRPLIVLQRMAKNGMSFGRNRSLK